MRERKRFCLAYLPTPLERLTRLGEALGGLELWIKRDDQTGLAGGGNKTRKLEFLVADALQQGADVILTVGAPQSNHCRQTAAAAARAALGCVLVLRGQAPPRQQWTGNLLLDELLGARMWWAQEMDPLAALEAAAEVERAAGRHPYIIPYGGSNAVGASAYALAFQELHTQVVEMAEKETAVCAPVVSGPFLSDRIAFDRIVFASSSGGTQAGLIVGAKACGYRGQVLGVSVHRTGEQLREVVAALLSPTAERLALDLSFGRDDIQIDDRYIGAGYGVLTSVERAAVRLVAELEGILLDPVYTGKAMAGLLDLVRRGEIGPTEKVLFWHTGGASALFAYAGSLLEG